jgi:aspartate 1-decarboxylase
VQYYGWMKLRTICKSKIHHATVTSSDIDYIGSIGIDQTLMELTERANVRRSIQESLSSR